MKAGALHEPELKVEALELEKRQLLLRHSVVPVKKENLALSIVSGDKTLFKPESISDPDDLYV